MQLSPSRRALAAARRIFAAFGSKEAALDLVERAAVLTLFLWFANRMLPQFQLLIFLQMEHPELILQAATTNIEASLLVASELLGVYLILTRRSTASLSRRPFDWAISFIGVSASFLVVPAAPSNFISPYFASALMIAGMLLQISAKGALWRSFGVVPANRGVKTGGPYRIVRHPMYAGYTLTHIGFLLGFPLLQNALLYATVLLIEVVRLMREEAILRQDPAYREYAARVRYRLVPGLF